jgi:two-component system phosphate regulon sensor histidine kinase PhoR
MERFVLNLLDNALRYTHRGGTVHAIAGRDGSRATLEVADTGIGIPPDLLPHVFERFYRAGQPAHAQGAGIGLALVRWIAETHGGTVTVTSQVGVGSRFRLSLPQGESYDAANPRPR